MQALSERIHKESKCAAGRNKRPVRCDIDRWEHQATLLSISISQILSDSVRFSWILGDSGGFWGILGDSGGFWEILGDSGGFWKILEDSV